MVRSTLRPRAREAIKNGASGGDGRRTAEACAILQRRQRPTRASRPHRPGRISQIAVRKESAARTLGRRTTRPRGRRGTLYTDPPASARLTRDGLTADEANLPAQEAQARPHARVPCADAHACRPSDDQAPPQEGALAAHRLSGAGRWTGREERRRSRPRLSRSADFERVYRQGRSVASRHLVLYAFPREDAPRRRGTRPTFGSASRSAAGWVVRSSATASSACCARPSGRCPTGSPTATTTCRRAAWAAELADTGGLDVVPAELAALLERLELRRPARRADGHEAAGPRPRDRRRSGSISA